MNRQALFWGLAGAVAVWLGFPSDFGDAPALVLLWPVALAALGLSAPAARPAFVRGWMSGFAGMTAALYWVTLPMAQVGGLPWFAAAGCTLFVTFCLSTACGLFSLAAHLCRAMHPFRMAVFLGLLWAALEALYAVTAGFPWLPIAGALAPWPVMIQAADTCGAWGLGALWTTASLLLFFALAGHPNTAKRPLAAGLAGLALTSALLGYGAFRLKACPFEDEPKGEGTMGVLFVEGNVDQNKKWAPAFQRQSVDLYMRLTAEGLAARPDEKPLVIWPETAMPFIFTRTPHLAELVKMTARTNGCPLLFGAPDRAMPTPAEQRAGKQPPVYNRAILLDPEGRVSGHYDKQHLVPFGEYAPAWADFDFLAPLLQGVGIFSPGGRADALRQDDIALGMLICYEGIFPWLARERVESGANILADISNDGWFSTTPASRQHLYLTALRAVEEGRWILRGTNTGISAVIDSCGRIVRHGPQFKTGTVYARARLNTETTRWHALSSWLMGATLLAILLIPLAGRCRRNPDSTR